MNGEDTMPERRGPQTWWFVAALLALFALLMASHIGMLWVQVYECDRYSAVRLQEAEDYVRNPSAQGKSLPDFLPRAEQCRELRSTFTDAANLYLATILALLSGAGFSTGRASANPPKGSDTP